MARFPYFGFPFQYPYYRYHNQYSNHENQKNELDFKKQDASSKDAKENPPIQTDDISNTRKISSKNNQILPFNINFNGFDNSDNPIIELLGIKLYLDDIIILCLLFILYKEDVKDEMLLIILVLLLLS